VGVEEHVGVARPSELAITDPGLEAVVVDQPHNASSEAGERQHGERDQKGVPGNQQLKNYFCLKIFSE